MASTREQTHTRVNIQVHPIPSDKKHTRRIVYRIIRHIADKRGRASLPRRRGTTRATGRGAPPLPPHRHTAATYIPAAGATMLARGAGGHRAMAGGAASTAHSNMATALRPPPGRPSAWGLKLTPGGCGEAVPEPDECSLSSPTKEDWQLASGVTAFPPSPPPAPSRPSRPGPLRRCQKVGVSHTLASESPSSRAAIDPFSAPLAFLSGPCRGDGSAVTSDWLGDAWGGVARGLGPAAAGSTAACAGPGEAFLICSARLLR
mmetsp:Transcript_31273/g.79372  ORF Transcript_31273/g.79372 Transcript_31273/m.79372 type:complete len:261 (+) Transcript_31273:309-1091(+)